MEERRTECVLDRISLPFSIDGKDRNKVFHGPTTPVTLEISYSATVRPRIRVELNAASLRWNRENNRGRKTRTEWREEKERQEKEPRCLGEQNKLVKPLNDP